LERSKEDLSLPLRNNWTRNSVLKEWNKSHFRLHRCWLWWWSRQQVLHIRLSFLCIRESCLVEQ
jgi:hypothetical protein